LAHGGNHMALPRRLHLRDLHTEVIPSIEPLPDPGEVPVPSAERARVGQIAGEKDLEVLARLRQDSLEVATLKRVHGAADEFDVRDLEILGPSLPAPARTGRPPAAPRPGPPASFASCRPSASPAASASGSRRHRRALPSRPCAAPSRSRGPGPWSRLRPAPARRTAAWGSFWRAAPPAPSPPGRRH